MNFTGDLQGQGPDPRTLQWVGRYQGVRLETFIQVFANSHGLCQYVALVQQNRHQALRVDAAVCITELFASLPYQVHRYGLEGQPLEV